MGLASALAIKTVTRRRRIGAAVLTGAVVFAAVLAATGGRRLQRAGQLDSHINPTAI